jgi:ankyrin repeat protein
MNSSARSACWPALLLFAQPIALCASAAPAQTASGVTAIETVRIALRTRQFGSARERLRVLANAGDTEAQYLLGQILLNGVGVPADTKAAADWLLRAAQRNHAPAAYVLAAVFERQSPSDHAAARLWLQKSADLGYVRASDALRDHRPLLAADYGSGNDATLVSELALFAARSNDVELLAELGKPATAASDAFGRSSLATACTSGALAAAKWLLDNGADVRATDSFGTTPLMLTAEAAEGGSAVSLVELLLQHGAEVASVDQEKRSALFYAARRNRADLIVRLAAAHAPLEATDSRGYSALDAALTSGADAAAAELHRQGVRQSLSVAAHSVHGRFDAAHPGQVYRDWSAAALAAARDDADAVRDQLAAGAPVNLRTPQGDTLLHVALHAQSLRVIELLLARGADAAAADKRGRSVIGLSIARKTPELLQLLLKSGVSADAHAAGEVAPLLLSAAAGNVAAAQTLLASRARVNVADATGQTPLLLAAASGNSAMVELLLSGGADVRQRNQRGQSALWLAARAGNVEVAQRLINAHADVDTADVLGRTPLMMAAGSGDAKVAALLLSSSARSELATPDGDTALLVAAAAGHSDVLPLLLRGPPVTNQQNRHGDTALIAASRFGNAMACRLLLAAGASTALRNKNRASAADVARERGFTSLAQEIEKRS